MNFRKNKKAWIRIVEAFTAILLITGASLIVLNKNNVVYQDLDSEIYNTEASILRSIQTNENLRTDILKIKTNTFPSDPPSSTISYIEDQLPSYLECNSKICSVEDECLISIEEEKNIYTQSTLISADSKTYSPRQLKLFCWEK